MSVLHELAETLRAEGGLLGDAVREPTGEPLGIAGPRALAVEAIREGHLLHRGAPRVLDGADPDLALLAGDRLYALGLARLADAGDLAAVRAMAEVIAASAAALGEGDDAAAQAAWEQGLRAVSR
jgi:hypothetical protein